MTSPSEYRPTLEDLGAILRARTRDAHGDDEAGTFTEDTRPTAAQADDLIDRALDLVAGRLGDVPPRLAGMARTIVALRAAMLVEASFFPEEATGTEDTLYAAIREQYREALADYDAAIDRNVGEGYSKVASVRLPTPLNP